MAIAVDQLLVGSAHPADGTTTAMTTTATVAAGAFIVVACGHFTDSPVLNTVTNTGSSVLSWAIDVQGPNPTASASYIAMASAQAPSGLTSGAVITTTWASSAIAPAIGAISFTGVKTSSSVDALGTVTGTTSGGGATAAWTTGSIALSAGSVLVGTSWSEEASAVSAITSPSIEWLEIIDSGFGQTAGYRIEPSAGSYSVAGTWGTNLPHVEVGVA